MVERGISSIGYSKWWHQRFRDWLRSSSVLYICYVQGIGLRNTWGVEHGQDSAARSVIQFFSIWLPWNRWYFSKYFRPSGSGDEGKRFYSGQNKLHGYKHEINVFRTDLRLVQLNTIRACYLALRYSSAWSIGIYSNCERRARNDTCKTAELNVTSIRECGNYCVQRVSGDTINLSWNYACEKAPDQRLYISNLAFNRKL